MLTPCRGESLSSNLSGSPLRRSYVNFYHDNVNVGAGQTICGNTLGTAASNTTATQVAFGSLQLAAFNDLAQRLSCVTNSRFAMLSPLMNPNP
jgi:hypothetical protein